MIKIVTEDIVSRVGKPKRTYLSKGDEVTIINQEYCTGLSLVEKDGERFFVRQELLTDKVISKAIEEKTDIKHDPVQSYKKATAVKGKVSTNNNQSKLF